MNLSFQPLEEDDPRDDDQRAWIPASEVRSAVERWPEHLTRTVDQWFAQNTGLGGCSDKDVSELAVIFYGLTYQGGRESVDDALAVVGSFGPGVEGLNDTFSRQVLLAQEVIRLRGLYMQAVKGRQDMREALMTARDHIDMDELRISHGKDTSIIESAAQAVYEASSNLWMTNAPYDELHDDDKAECRSMARAALATDKPTRGHMGSTVDGGIADH